MSTVQAWAALEAGAKLQPFTYEMPPAGPEEVEIEVTHCGLCHTDLAFIHNEWGMIPFPLVPGHEIVGRIAALGEVAAAKGLSVGQTVGVGWNKQSCQHCDPCLEGAPHLCSSLQATIFGNHGGFADRVKAHWLWTIPVPAELDAADAGPLFCAGITVFSPLMEYALRPTARVGVFGIGGLGHLALQFCRAWGSDVTAFSSTRSKYDEILALGASHVVSSRDPAEWEALKGKFDLLLVTVAVPLDWDKITAMLAPKGRLHFVGIVDQPIPVHVMSLLGAQASLSASPSGARSSLDKMLRFAARHRIAPRVEHFPMSKVNDAIAHLEAGKASYRVVLDADFA
ncbi:NADPH-dependent aldehyde reductase Ahr [Cupriavidus sp. 30B13]|uniref:NADPH-dependent aldehyde reductase Ahr n=1 Tax=Cupriavidus sp. 30B13 TaxID=3384241 RepID=UPI003B917A5A